MEVDVGSSPLTLKNADPLGDAFACRSSPHPQRSPEFTNWTYTCSKFGILAELRLVKTEAFDELGPPPSLPRLDDEVA